MKLFIFSPVFRGGGGDSGDGERVLVLPDSMVGGGGVQDL